MAASSLLTKHKISARRRQRLPRLNYLALATKAMATMTGNISDLIEAKLSSFLQKTADITKELQDTTERVDEANAFQLWRMLVSIRRSEFPTWKKLWHCCRSVWMTRRTEEDVRI